MLSSRKIGIISLILMLTALVLVVCLHYIPTTDGDVSLGETVYGDGQSVSFDKTDYYTDYTAESFYTISLNGDKVTTNSNNVLIDGTNIKISGGGTYEITGSMAGGNITVDAHDGVMVRLVLAGTDIISINSPAINVIQAEKTVISLAKDTVNTLVSNGEFADSDAVIYSKDDLVINGAGALNVLAEYSDAIKCNDGLKITGGTLDVNAIDEGINANDYIVISDGEININQATDAIKCENSDDDTLGFIALEGGILNLTASDDTVYAGSDIYINNITATLASGGDAVHAEKKLIMNNGTIDISECNEGFEGAYITVNDGEYRVVAKDDALNATGENSGMSRPGGMRGGTIGKIYLTINGGKIYAKVGGDGIDSNGAAEINGGYIEVYGPENSGNSTLDFDGGFTVNGGTVIAAGSSGMAESPSETSVQNSIVVTFSKTYTPGTTFSVKDKNGETVMSGLSTKRFDWICVSSDKFITGEEYKVYVNEAIEASVTISSAVTSVSKRINAHETPAR